MFDTIQKLKYRASAGIAQAQDELNSRLNDRMELPLPGLHGEKLYLTGVTALREKAAVLNAMYEKQQFLALWNQISEKQQLAGIVFFLIKTGKSGLS